MRVLSLVTAVTAAIAVAWWTRDSVWLVTESLLLLIVCVVSLVSTALLLLLTAKASALSIPLLVAA